MNGPVIRLVESLIRLKIASPKAHEWGLHNIHDFRVAENRICLKHNLSKSLITARRD